MAYKCQISRARSVSGCIMRPLYPHHDVFPIFIVCYQMFGEVILYQLQLQFNIASFSSDCLHSLVSVTDIKLPWIASGTDFKN